MTNVHMIFSQQDLFIMYGLHTHLTIELEGITRLPNGSISKG